MAPNAAPYDIANISVPRTSSAATPARRAPQCSAASTSGGAFLLPRRRLGEKRPDQNQRNRRDDADINVYRHAECGSRIAPSRPKPPMAGRLRADTRCTTRCRGNHSVLHRGERLCVAEHPLASCRLGEELCEPRHGRRRNSTQTPTNIRHRSTSSISADVENPEAKHESA